MFNAGHIIIYGTAYRASHMSAFLLDTKLFRNLGCRKRNEGYSVPIHHSIEHTPSPTDFQLPKRPPQMLGLSTVPRTRRMYGPHTIEHVRDPTFPRDFGVQVRQADTSES